MIISSLLLDYITLYFSVYLQCKWFPYFESVCVSICIKLINVVTIRYIYSIIDNLCDILQHRSHSYITAFNSDTWLSIFKMKRLKKTNLDILL